METLNLGDSGLRVSAVILGCMTYGDPALGNHEWSVGLDESRPFFRQAIELGITTFDTANVYSLGSSEEITGMLLRRLLNQKNCGVMTKIASKTHPSSVLRAVLVPCVSFGPVRITVGSVRFVSDD